MGSHHFRDKWIKTANELTSRFVIMRKCSPDQWASIKIVHVVEIASTLLTMTGPDALRLHLCSRSGGFHAAGPICRVRPARRAKGDPHFLKKL
jgi:hypothetical protein